MSICGMIARLTNALPPQFVAMMRVLIDAHPAGWSTINGADLNMLSGFTKMEN